MNTQTILGAFVVSALIISSAPAFAQHSPRQERPQAQDRAQVERGQMDRDRDYDRDRIQDRDRVQDPSLDRDRIRDQDRTKVPDFAQLNDDDIYGRELMSQQERNEYRMQLQAAGSAEERRQIEARHRDMIQTRAQEQGVEIVAPGKGIYGGALMTVEERSRFREQLRSIGSAEERRQFLAEHRVEIQQRAKARGVPFNELEKTDEPD